MRICILFLALLVLSACSNHLDDPPLPFQITSSLFRDRSNYPLNTGDDFSVHVGVEAKIPVRNVIIKVIAPEGVKINWYSIVTQEKGRTDSTGPTLPNSPNVIIWQGNVIPDYAWYESLFDIPHPLHKSLAVSFKALKPGASWSGDIKGEISFDYDDAENKIGARPMNSGRYTESFSWSADKWVNKPKDGEKPSN